MSKSLVLIAAAAAGCLVTLAADWPTLSGNQQRNGWARSERTITKANVAKLQILYKFHADNQSRALNSLSSPIINGNLITFLGFKEMLVFGASSGKVFSVDADLNQLLWEAHLSNENSAAPAPSSMVCPGGMTAPVIMPGSSSAGIHFAAARRGVIASRPIPGPHNRPMSIVPPFQAQVTPLDATTIQNLSIFYAVGADGELHLLNSFTGEDLVKPLQFVPPNSKITSLNIWHTTVYATTADDCNGASNALYALDFLRPDKYVWSFSTDGSGFSGIGGTAIGRDGTVYVQVAQGENSYIGHLRDTVLALTAKDLRVRDYFTPPGKARRRKPVGSEGITPTVFPWNGKELIAAGDSDGHLYLLDSASLGGPDHRSPLFATNSLSVRKKRKGWYGFHGAFSSWLDLNADTRWLYAPYWGALPHSGPLPVLAGDDTEGGHMLAFKMTQSAAQPTLEPAWVSGNIPTPSPGVIANGMLFTLSSGEAPSLLCQHRKPCTLQAWEQRTRPARLLALDSATGKQLFTSGDSIKTFAHHPDLALANGRIYFGAHDNNLYCLGIPTTQPQLTDRR